MHSFTSWLSMACLSTMGALSAVSCTGNSAADQALQIKEIRVPAQGSSGESHLFAGSNGKVYLSWLEKVEDEKYALRFSAHQESGWSAPGTIAQSREWFVNWADFPSLIALDDNRLAAHWLAKSGSGTYAYNVNIVQSTDGGSTWGPAVTPHKDGTETEHGFVSMLPWFDDRIFAVWLDGRNFAEESAGQGQPANEMTLRFATLDRNGAIFDEAVLDTRVCECCQTSAARTKNGAVVAYRNRSEEEIRDISIVRWVDGRWTEPKTLHQDNWKFPGCPVNGPSVAADGNRVAIAWFTAANEVPKVLVAFSSDEGESFGNAIQLNEGETVGRVQVVLLEDGAALVSWMESTEQAGEIRICRVRPDGSQDIATTLAQVSTGRASGFPRMIRSGNQVYFAWTEVGEPSTIRTAVAEIPL